MNGRVDPKAADAAKKVEESGSAPRDTTETPRPAADPEVKEWVYRTGGDSRSGEPTLVS